MGDHRAIIRIEFQLPNKTYKTVIRQHGWRPSGGLAVVNCGYRRYLYIQAMVRDNYDWNAGITSSDKQ